MKLVTAIVTVLLCAIVIVLAPSIPERALATTPTPPAARTGAPGEATCNNCHSGDSGNASFILTTVPALITEYVPGQTYNIALGLEDPGLVRWGFEVTALKDSDNSMAGTFTTLIDTHVTTKSSGGRTYACHTTNGATSSGDPNDGTWWGTPDGPVAWAFQWTAPPQGSGSVTFYASGVSANGDGDDTGDNGYSGQMTLTEGVPSPVEQMTWGKIKQIYR